MDTLAARDHRRARRLTDLLDSIRAELRTRLDELRPLVREYERLQEAEAALADGSPATGKRAGRTRGGSQARRGGARRAGSHRRSSSSAEREVNREKVAALVRERPGITRQSSRTRPGSRAPASPRICGGCSTAARCARKRCRAARPATGSLTAEPSRARAPANARPATRQTPCRGARRSISNSDVGRRNAPTNPGSRRGSRCALLTSDS
jgi:hypothetical protein